MKVCHLTSVHKWNDTRIFHKECSSLVKHGMEVYLVVPADQSHKSKGVEVIAVEPNQSGRLARATKTAYNVYRAALKTKAEIFHFHDPELVWVGILLKLRGKKVIFDIHENIREQIMAKKWLKFRGLISKLYWVVDFLSARLFFLILAESSYESIYEKLGANYITIMNYPDTSGLSDFFVEDRSVNENGIFYVGGISFDRGIDVTLDALKILVEKEIPFHFHCIGAITSDLDNWYRNHEAYSILKGKITFYGAKDVFEAYEISKQCKVGLSVLKPIKNYVNSYSTKIFEYMSVGLPVITSDFQLYKDVIERHKCGYCIDPESPEKLAESMIEIFNDPNKGKEFGKNGHLASKRYYSWKGEEEKLLRFYEQILRK